MSKSNIFQIQDITDEIVEHIGLEDEPSFSLVNKTCSYSGLPMLWKMMSVQPALDFLALIESPAGDKLSPAVRDGALERFHLCTRSVRVLFGSDSDNEALKTAVKSKYIESSCLFPNLRSLTWISGGCYDHWNVNSLLLSPTLVKFEVATDPDWVVHPFCGPWTNWIEYEPRSADVSAKSDSCEKTSLANSVPLLKNLQTLTIPDSIITDSLLKALGTLTGFQALTVTSKIGHYSNDKLIRFKDLEKEANPTEINKGVASSWTSLQFCDVSDNRPKFIHLFEPHRFPFLTHVIIRRGDAGIAAEFGRLIRAVAKSALSLESLVVGPNKRSNSTCPHVEWRIISSILTCKNLIKFEVYSWRIAMTAVELKEFAKSRATWVSVAILPVTPFNKEDITVFGNCPNLEMFRTISRFDLSSVTGPY